MRAEPAILASSPAPGAIADASRRLGLSPAGARWLLTQQGGNWESLEKFLNPSIAQLYSPWLLPDMQPAVARLQKALRQREGILIYGDYDVDGTTAATVLRVMLQRLGAQPQCYIPHRLNEGYGLRAEVLEKAASDGIRVVITVDNGIRAHAELERARQLPLDVIVTDHHPPAGDLPPATAVVNPMRRDSGYPEAVLCGAGLAFKLGQALMEAEGRLAPGTYPAWLVSFFKLLALGTIADHVPLTGENRVFVRLGLDGLTKPSNPGLRALLEQALPGHCPIRAADVAFRLAPRLNAAGRMDHAEAVLRLFSADTASAGQIALQLDQWNQRRQACENAILEAIAQQAQAEPERLTVPVLLFEGEGWHRGVLGSVAARLQRQYRHPALVMAHEDGRAHASGRSMRGFNLLASLEPCANLFTHFGGHAQAVGLTMETRRVADLRQYLREVKLTVLDEAPAAPPFQLDLDEVLPFSQDLDRLGPFGAGNPEPQCFTPGVLLLRPVQWLKSKHLKLWVGAKGQAFECLAWNAAERKVCADGQTTRLANLNPGQRLDLNYRLELPNSRGGRLQWVLLYSEP